LELLESILEVFYWLSCFLWTLLGRYELKKCWICWKKEDSGDLVFDDWREPDWRLESDQEVSLLDSWRCEIVKSESNNDF
jgi:hypothetical protein